MTIFKWTIAYLCLVVFVAGCAEREAEEVPTAPANPITTGLVEDAYTWGLPIVAMYRYYDLMGPKVGGLNQLFHNRRPIQPGVLSGGPNRDGLYSFGWLDLNDEPIIVTFPDFGDRYFVMQFTDMFAHNFHNVGSYLRQGPVEKYASGYAFALAGPDWQGEAPDGLDVVRAPVGVVNVLYRIAVIGEADFEAGNELQDSTHFLPLSAWEDGERSGVARLPSNPIPEYREVLAFGPEVTAADQRNPMFWSVLADALAANEPYAVWDKEFVTNQLARLGVVPGEPFDFEGLDAATQQLIVDAQESAFEKIIATGNVEFGDKMNGWLLNPAHHGDWEDDFQNRAYATYTGGMYPVANNSTYATTYNDANDVQIDGSKTYRLRFEADELPPVTSFWSVTAYDAGTRDLYPNEAELYNYGTNIPYTRYEDDGSVEIILSHEEPANSSDINWMPIPSDRVWIAVRFYAPKDEVMDRTYELPGLKLLD